MREPCGIQRGCCGASAEQKRNPHDREARDGPLATFTTSQRRWREHRRPSRVAVSGFRGGDPVWWGSQTSTGATPESAWKWRAPSATRVPAQACCRWRRSGFAWPTGCRPTLKMNPIRSKVEVPLARSRPRAWTTPAPSRAGSGGGARSRPVRPGAGIPRQICDIVWTGPFVATTRAVRSCVPDACESCRPEPPARARDVSRASLGWSSSQLGNTSTGCANSSAAPADSGLHPGTRTPRC